MVPPASHKLTGVRGTQVSNGLAQLCSTGLSPAVVTLSNVFESALLTLCVGPYNPWTSSCEEAQVWAPPISLATTLGISFDFFSSSY